MKTAEFSQNERILYGGKNGFKDAKKGDVIYFSRGFHRSYTSAARLKKVDNHGFGYGWAHNYDIRLEEGSAGNPVLGLRTPVDTTSMIVARHVISDLGKSGDTIPKVWGHNTKKLKTATIQKSVSALRTTSFWLLDVSSEIQGKFLAPQRLRGAFVSRRQATGLAGREMPWPLHGR